jgi:hypothetical protein
MDNTEKASFAEHSFNVWPLVIEYLGASQAFNESAKGCFRTK